MKIIKQPLDMIERVYATSFMGSPVPDKLLIASEGYGECRVINLPDFEKETVKDNPGGATDLCPNPLEEGVFFAISNFLPVFQSEEAKLTYVKKNSEGKWQMNTIARIPFLHRFDVLAMGEKLIFVGATLCGSKKDRDDWSDPGKVIVGEIDRQTYELKNVRTVLDGLLRNHGFIRTGYNGKDSYLISGDFGTWVLPLPENFNDQWMFRKLFDFPVSDIAVWDIDGDGKEEIALITPFHGNEFKILKKENGEYRTVFSREIAFGHVLWGGEINGTPSFLLGYRQGDEKLLLFRTDGEGGFIETLIDSDSGPSQISCFQGVGCFHILSANRKTGNIIGEAALYTLFEN